MDFIPQREFFHPEVQSKTKGKRTSENVSLLLVLLMEAKPLSLSNTELKIICFMHRCIYQAMFMLLRTN